MQQKDFSGITESAIYGLGSGVGWLLRNLAIAAIREKITYSNVPAPLRGWVSLLLLRDLWPWDL